MIPHIRSDETALAVVLPPGAEHGKRTASVKSGPLYGMSAHSIMCIASSQP